MSNPVFRETRNVELSTIYYIDNQISADWTGVTVTKSKANIDKLSLPVIAIKLLSDNSSRREIGSVALNTDYNILIDIFAKSDGQRSDLADFLKSTLTSDWIYYEHARQSGDPEALSRTANGKILFQQFTQNAQITFNEDVEFYDKFRHVISFNCRVAKNG